MALIDIKSMTTEELREDFKTLGQPAFRALQVFKWLHVRGAVSFEAMTDLSKPLREMFAKRYYISVANIANKQVSAYDSTIKYLFSLYDGETVESVLMKYHHGYSICISTQVGCRMGCTFCATGIGGFCRNLMASEMIAQIQSAQLDQDIRISNVVLMGMGEPLDNYDQVTRFLDLVSCPDGMNIGMRHISLSTCGLVNRIYDLAGKNYQLTLSVSLHAPNDEIRKKTMPVANRFSMDALLKACRYYADVTKRRISYEYAMISGINDSDDCARELARKLRGTLCHVNLIPINEVSESGFVKSKSERLKAFADILAKVGITVTVRRTLGSDIDASCGQLRRRHVQRGGTDLEHYQ